MGGSQSLRSFHCLSDVVVGDLLPAISVHRKRPDYTAYLSYAEFHRARITRAVLLDRARIRVSSLIFLSRREFRDAILRAPSRAREPISPRAPASLPSTEL